MKAKLISALIVAASAMGAQMAHAAPDGTITFTGNITADSCKINGGSAPQNFAVTLPTVTTGDLPADGATAGSTGFRIALTNCPASVTSVHTFFEAGPTVDLGTGRLITTGGATNVQLELLNKDNVTVIKAGASDGMSAGQQKSVPVTVVSGAANLDYYVRYHATGGAAGAGGANSTVMYDISYN